MISNIPPNESYKFSENIYITFELLGLTENSDRQQKLDEYAKLILKWNKTYNLTAFKEIKDIYIQHINDSLAIVKPIEDYLLSKNLNSAKIYDVGSGAGLPGIVLAIMCPYLKVTCIDAVGKKVAFIKYVASVLNLNNLFAAHQRIELWQTEPVDLVISRAFSSMKNFVEWAGQHVTEGGHMVAMKARLSPEELGELEQQHRWKISRIEKVIVPQLSAERCLVWINKKERHDITE